MRTLLQPRARRGSRAATVGVTALVALLGLAPAARATTVELAVEAAGAPAPLFAGPVTTAPHPVDGGDGSGPHPCDGPAGAAPAATATGALDDAMRAAGIPWRGSWDPSFRDFFIDRIGAYASQAPDDYWSLSIDGHYAPGGCLAALADGDSVRFYYGPLFGEQPGADAGPGIAAPGGGGSNAGGGAAGGVRPGAATPARVRAVAWRATCFLRHHPNAPGSDWARLALALRDRHHTQTPGAEARRSLLSHRQTSAPGPPGDGGLDAPLAAAAGAILGDSLGALRRDGSVGEEANATALAVLALEPSRPRAASRAAAWLVGAQHPDGGFGYRPGVPADVDSTGLAAGRRAPARGGGAVRRAAAFVAAAQNPDGGFPSLPGGDSNSQSTGMALLALRLGGAGPRLGSPFPLDYLASLARRDGSLEYAPGSRPTPTWTTAQALLGLSSRARLLG